MTYDTASGSEAGKKGWARMSARGGYRWCPTRHLLVGRAQQAAKLTDDVVRNIRTIHIRYDHELGSTALARRYGVSSKLIRLVVDGVRWKHVPPVSRRAWE